MRLRLWIPLVLASLSGCFLWKRATEPNFLLIVVDSLRFDSLSQSLGAPRTTNLQRLAADGVSFPWCFSHTPDSLAAHAALLSARVPAATGAIGHSRAVAGDVQLVADWLTENHYRTFAAVGLPALGGEGVKTGLERGFQIFEGLPADRATAQDVNAAILPHLARAPDAAPWFAFVSYADPNQPYDAWGTDPASATIQCNGRTLDSLPIADGLHWERTLELPPGRHEITFTSESVFVLRDLECETQGSTIEATWTLGREGEPGQKLAVTLVNRSRETVRGTVRARMHDVPTLAQARARYKLEVENVDRAIGELLDELVRTGQYDDTVIVLTADHGAALGQHGAIADDSNLYDELLRVPLIFKPKKADSSTHSLRQVLYTLVRHADVVPTALDLLDVGPLPGTRGLSLFEAGERTLLAEAHAPQSRQTIFAMRDERYKLVYFSGDERFELYDLRADTLEVDNLFEIQGHIRRDWQTELRSLAALDPDSIRARVGFRIDDALEARKR